MSILSVVALAAAVVTISPAGAQETAAVRAVVLDRGFPAPGCAVGLFAHGKASFVSAGVVDMATQKPVDAETLFYSGSLAKQFTALAIAQLVAAKTLRLDDDIRRFLPEMRPTEPATTVAMLLHHTAGIPNTVKLTPLAGFDAVGSLTRRESISELLHYPGRAFPPGTTFEYSNGGYLLLSEIVERASGQAFEDYIEQRVLRPMGMMRSFILRGRRPADPNLARGYTPGASGFAVSEDYPLFGGAGGIMLTINDLARYHHDIAVGHRVWTPQVTRIMTEPGRYADGSPVIQPVPGYHFGYAAGLMLSHDWVLHGGNYAGYQALVAWLPGGDDGLAMLCNRGDFQLPLMAARIEAALHPDLPSIDRARFQLPSPPGRYVSDGLDATYRLEGADGGLRATISGPDGAARSVRTFRQTADRTYASETLTLTFDPDGRGFVAANGAVTQRFHRAP